MDSFMTVSLSYDVASRLTTGVLGFQAINDFATPGVLLLENIRDAASLVHDPMLIPVLLFDAWVVTLQREQHRTDSQVREVQEQTGLLNNYLRRQSVIQVNKDYDAAHQTLVQTHAYLTNGMADFVQDLAPSLMNCCTKAKEHIDKFPAVPTNPPSRQQKSPLVLNDHVVKQYIDSLRIRADAELTQRQRMLDRIAMYLQVLYNLMQQGIAIETRRDSSSMKSIALLTMVFLPATAIATVISPFITIDDRDRIVMTKQF